MRLRFYASLHFDLAALWFVGLPKVYYSYNRIQTILTTIQSHNNPNTRYVIVYKHICVVIIYDSSLWKKIQRSINNM